MPMFELDGGPIAAAGGSGGREDLLPVRLHVDHRPVALPGFVERLVEPADVRVPVIGIFALGIGVMNNAHETGTRPGGGPLQHLQVAVRIAESENRVAADEAVDADRLA